MKLKTTIALMASAFLSSPSVYSEQTSYLAPLADQSLLLDIVANDQKVLAVGERGHVLLSSDSAQSWQQLQVPTAATLTAVTVVGDSIWAVGHDSVIIGSTDSGQSWSVQQFLPELERPLMDVHFFDQQHGVALGAYGVFFRTTDGGNSWEREYHTSFLHPDDQEYLEELKEEDEAFYLEEMASILPHLNRVTESNGVLFVAGETGLLAKSQDQGRSWQRMESGYMGSFFDVVQKSDGSVLAAGLRGNVFQSDPEHGNWQRLDSQTTATLNSIVKLTGNDDYLLVGNNGTMIWYSDNSLELAQTDAGKAILNAVQLDGGVTAVSEVGIKALAR